jgi:hypothetical protein
MKKLALFLMVSLPVFHAGLSWSMENAGAPQESQSITGGELLRLFYSHSAFGSDRALSYIGEIYGPKINNGIIPDHETLYGLGRILMAYLEDHPASQDRPVADLVMEVLKNGPAQIEKHKILWAKAYKAAEAYFSQPSPENAEKFFMALPDRQLPGLDFQGEVRLVHFVFDFGQNFSNLEKRMEEGDRHAVDLGFRLINISDGAAGEVLGHAIGQILLKHPRLFLQKVLAHQGKTEPPVLELLEGILNPVGWWEIPEDDNDGAKYRALCKKNRDLRIKALESVKDSNLKDIRDRCLAVLQKMCGEIG